MIKELNYSWTQEDMKYYGEDLQKLWQDLKVLPKNKCKFSIQSFMIKTIIIILALCFCFFIIFLSKHFTNITACVLTGFFILSLIVARKGNFVISLPLSKNIKQLNQKLIIDSDSDKVMTKSDNDEIKVAFEWKDIKKIYNTEKNILLFIAKNYSFIIPKRIFNSEEELNETWNLIQECYNKSR